MSLPFLFEIGVEEVPDWMIQPALENIRELFSAILTEHRLGGSVTAVDATPRRLVLRAEDLLEAQPDQTVTVSGPPAAAPAGAVAGFAKKQGVDVADLVKVSSGKGEYWSLQKHVPGRKTIDILAETLPVLIGKIYFPKAMYWTGKGGARFIRPIRWIVALLGEDVVPFEFAGVATSDVTDGHRILGAKGLKVTHANYESTLKANGVYLSAAERRARIEAGLGDDVVRDEALLNTLVYLTECPSTFRGGFDPSYLQLPGEILTMVMRHHQRYFSVSAGEGLLKPAFVAVMNIDSDPDGLVQRGNERVLRARFNDARFFWDNDLKQPLGDRLEGLKNVTFQAKLGSYYEKTMRVVGVAKEIAAQLGVDVALAARAAELSKCDLPTDMVKEFTELQGVVGGLYARQQGEPEEVWRAVYSQYEPKSLEDTVPSWPVSIVVALADRVDTLRGCFSVGLMPTGSKDPFALRRAAQGVVKILIENRLSLSLKFLAGNDPELREFFCDRTRYYLRDIKGFAYDEVNAVQAVGFDDITDAWRRLIALRDVRQTPDFEALAQSFKRTKNILRQADFVATGEVDESLLAEAAEVELWKEMGAARNRMSSLGHGPALAVIASLRPAVDEFFNKVMVNVSDERVRQNRLTLLSSLLSGFSTIADFSEIVVSTQQ